SWLYRIRPSVRHTSRFKGTSYPLWKTAPNIGDHELALGQYRWNPVPMPAEPTDFISGMRTMTTAGDAVGQSGMAAHVYVANRSMVDDHFFNADGELMIVPQVGALRFVTEMGVIELRPGEIAVLPRGLVFKVELADKEARGYVCENYGAKFTMPDRGPIGANCLANPRDFKTPCAWFEEKETPCRLIVKWCGTFHVTELGHSPLDVVAWHGNYAPYKYDLATFSPVGAILFDHPDPSIFTVLTAPSGEAGTANVDFVIFPPRWLVAENTFRPPWYHRNIMSEFMGLIHGQYDAKEEGFVPGGISLHNQMLAHGPDATGFEKATRADLKPVKLDNTMAFMFETRFPQMLTRYAAELDTLQENYIDCWADLKKRFNGTPEGDWS
ncbi:homogentisate 1,2-dioxygenase, partial [Mesorhizobium sp. M1E.F.Ca.ET.063.01.1.1]